MTADSVILLLGSVIWSRIGFMSCTSGGFLWFMACHQKTFALLFFGGWVFIVLFFGAGVLSFRCSCSFFFPLRVFVLRLCICVWGVVFMCVKFLL